MLRSRASGAGGGDGGVQGTAGGEGRGASAIFTQGANGPSPFVLFRERVLPRAHGLSISQVSFATVSHDRLRTTVACLSALAVDGINIHATFLARGAWTAFLQAVLIRLLSARLQAELTALLSVSSPHQETGVGAPASGPAGISGGAAVPRRAGSVEEAAMLKPCGAVSALLTAGFLTRGLQQEGASLWFAFPNAVSHLSAVTPESRLIVCLRMLFLFAAVVGLFSDLDVHLTNKYETEHSDACPLSYPAYVQGVLAKAIQSGRQVLTSAIQKQPLKQIRQRDVEKLKIRGSPFPAVFHIRDMIGSHLLSSVTTTTGPLLRLGDRSESARDLRAGVS